MERLDAEVGGVKSATPSILTPPILVRTPNEANPAAPKALCVNGPAKSADAMRRCAPNSQTAWAQASDAPATKAADPRTQIKKLRKMARARDGHRNVVIVLSRPEGQSRLLSNPNRLTSLVEWLRTMCELVHIRCPGARRPPPPLPSPSSRFHRGEDGDGDGTAEHGEGQHQRRDRPFRVCVPFVKLARDLGQILQFSIKETPPRY